jgi:hypothetical protein
MLKRILGKLVGISNITPLDSALEFGGFVLAHTAVVAAALEPGDLICPFALVTKGPNRQVLDFEAETQAEAVERGKASLSELKDKIDLWGFGRDGLHGEAEKPESKVDALVVSAWTHGMEGPVNLLQRFRPKQSGAFALFGPTEIIVDGVVQEAEVAARLRALVRAGIDKHPQGGSWPSWFTHQ